ncbi:hypothetical protein CVH13_00628 [Dehalococcoides mccartyi]|uniref:Uncharacterized protein n=1 Tax=Dehalococcoides mccartyi TaxID=61435 RepID=A0A2J1DYU0_9CHLR|nr:hypothetical protein CVH13_00628 [Dehalococcoides mccartyi]
MNDILRRRWLWVLIGLALLAIAVVLIQPAFSSGAPPAPAAETALVEQPAPSDPAQIASALEDPVTSLSSDSQEHQPETTSVAVMPDRHFAPDGGYLQRCSAWELCKPGTRGIPCTGLYLMLRLIYQSLVTP